MTRLTIWGRTTIQERCHTCMWPSLLTCASIGAASSTMASRTLNYRLETRLALRTASKKSSQVTQKYTKSTKKQLKASLSKVSPSEDSKGSIHPQPLLINLLESNKNLIKLIKLACFAKFTMKTSKLTPRTIFQTDFLKGKTSAEPKRSSERISVQKKPKQKKPSQTTDNNGKNKSPPISKNVNIPSSPRLSKCLNLQQTTSMN